MARLGIENYPSEYDDENVDSINVMNSEAYPGVPDEFQRLWTPHRLVYLQNGQQPDENECPFCYAPSRQDNETLIVRRAEHSFVVLNLFPYNSGHLLVCPYRHIGTYDLASEEEVAEIGKLTQQAMHVLRKASNAHGFNIGLNQGEVAGAGIAGHLHQHIVPRWAQDANFMPIIAKTKALPRMLNEVRDSISTVWQDLYG